jgi:hypothetical protein
VKVVLLRRRRRTGEGLVRGAIAVVLVGGISSSSSSREVEGVRVGGGKAAAVVEGVGMRRKEGTTRAVSARLLRTRRRRPRWRLGRRGSLLLLLLEEALYHLRFTLRLFPGLSMSSRFEERARVRLPAG